jgi:hypothetical protein
MRRLPPALVATLAGVLLAGCDLLGIEGASAIAERRAAEGKAIGAACRNAARAIEDCYTLNKKADKAAIYAGWREMDDYMRENKLEPVPPQLTPEVARAGAKAEEESADDGPKADHKSGTRDAGDVKEARAGTKKPTATH